MTEKPDQLCLPLEGEEDRVELPPEKADVVRHLVGALLVQRLNRDEEDVEANKRGASDDHRS